MISVLISVFNHDPSQLVEDLSRQMANLPNSGEIILGNDCSDSTFVPIYQNLAKLTFVQVFNSGKNLGRSKMRNTLAQKANFPSLLFIDGDAEVCSADFLDKYSSEKEDKVVVCGGTAYRIRSEIEDSQVLRWKYGVKREVKSATDRNRFPQRSFSSFNFMIPAKSFEKVKFNENISRYGHEDTLFGIELVKNNIRIKHVDNQLIHSGLDTANVFLEKTVEGIENLVDLMKEYPEPVLLEENIRIIKRYRRYKRWGLKFTMKIIKGLAGKMIERNLRSRKPSILLFDVYKLIVLRDIQS